MSVADNNKFNLWWEQFCRFSKEKDFPVAEQECYREYFEDDLTPEDAFWEEISCAQ